MRKVILIADNLRSAHNVGSLLRSTDGLGVSRVYLTGYTPHPPSSNDGRLPHEKTRALAQIHKTALGAENSVQWHYEPDVGKIIDKLRAEGYTIAALEQSPQSLDLQEYEPPNKVALLVGNEVDGLSPKTLKFCEVILEIPMKGTKESFNVVVASVIALYHLMMTN